MNTQRFRFNVTKGEGYTRKVAKNITKSRVG